MRPITVNDIKATISLLVKHQQPSDSEINAFISGMITMADLLCEEMPEAVQEIMAACRVKTSPLFYCNICERHWHYGDKFEKDKDAPRTIICPNCLEVETKSTVSYRP